MIPQKIARIPFVHALLAVALAALWAWSPVASAQAEELTKAQLARKKTDIDKILRDQDAPNELFDQYFNDYFFPQFRTAINDLPRVRHDLRLFFQRGKRGDAYDHLNELTLKKMTSYFGENQGKYDAAIKYNALLVIGELNENDEGGKPKPWTKAFPFLLRAAKAKSDYMKAAALVGLERHAATPGAIPQVNVLELTKLLVELVNQKDPPAGRDPLAHQFLRRSAAEILAVMGNPGPDNSVVKALEAVAADTAARPTLRCEMAQFLGQLKYPPAAKVDLKELANCVGHQAIEICRQELEAARAASRAPSRRQIMYALASTMAALGGTDGRGGLKSAATGTPAAEFVASLYTKVKAAHAAFDTSESVDELADTDVATVTEKIGDVEGILAPKTAAKPEQLMAAERKEAVVAPAKQ